MKNQILILLPYSWRWVRKARGGKWVYYQTTLSMPAVWMKVMDFKAKLPCHLYTIKEEEYSD
jgi:hypothetical protein